MSFEILYQDQEDKKFSKLKILERNEFSLLTDKEKWEYLAGPMIYPEFDSSKSFNDYQLECTFYVESFLIDRLIFNTGDFALKEVNKGNDEYKELFVEIANWAANIDKSFSQSEQSYDFDPRDYYPNYPGLDEREFKYQLFRINKFYEKDLLYELMVNHCKEQSDLIKTLPRKKQSY